MLCIQSLKVREVVNTYTIVCVFLTSMKHNGGTSPSCNGQNESESIEIESIEERRPIKYEIVQFSGFKIHVSKCFQFLAGKNLLESSSFGFMRLLNLSPQELHRIVHCGILAL